jgi:vacuolar-type H+-ATPase subunit H
LRLFVCVLRRSQTISANGGCRSPREILRFAQDDVKKNKREILRVAQDDVKKNKCEILRVAQDDFN